MKFVVVFFAALFAICGTLVFILANQRNEARQEAEAYRKQVAALCYATQLAFESYRLSPEKADVWVEAPGDIFTPVIAWNKRANHKILKGGRVQIRFAGSKENSFEERDWANQSEEFRRVGLKVQR